VNGWSEWGGCDSQCGQGQQARRRDILQAAEPQGTGCSLPLREMRGCVNAGDLCETDQDCEWGMWEQWSECGKAVFCGTGFRTRKRSITKQPRGMKGKLCEPRAEEEVVPFASCPGSCDSRSCVDGEWGGWGAWSQCTVSCGGGGSRVRKREEVVKANDCGHPAEGDLEEYGVCHSTFPCEEESVVAVDCVFGPWRDYTPLDCPARCNGGQTRTRTITQYSSHGGKPCEGPTAEAVRCNPSPGLPSPPDCTSGVAVDCKLTVWSEWSGCNAECGTGHKERKREVLTSPEFGGEDCENPLWEIEECSAAAECVDNTMDCQWADWKGWGPCDAQTGQKVRAREIIQHKVGRGLDCQGAIKQVTACARDCEAKQYACQWGSWGMWGRCSTTCGHQGRRTRARGLAISYEVRNGTLVIPMASEAFAYDNVASAANPPSWVASASDPFIAQKYDMVHQKLLSTGMRRHTDLAAAFAAGLVTLAAGFGLARYGLVSRRLRPEDMEAIDARAARIAPLAPAASP